MRMLGWIASGLGAVWLAAGGCAVENDYTYGNAPGGEAGSSLEGGSAGASGEMAGAGERNGGGAAGERDAGGAGGEPNGGAGAGERADGGDAGSSPAGSAGVGGTAEPEIEGGTSGGGADTAGSGEAGSSGGVDDAAGAGGAAGDDGTGDGGAGTGGVDDGGGQGSVIQGTVRNGDGSFVPGVQVFQGDSDTTTNADGEFELEDVPDVYDLMLVDGDYVVAVYGLVRRDPVIRIGGSGIPLETTEVSGSLTGAGYPLPANHIVGIGLSGPRAQGFVKTAATSYGPVAFTWPSTNGFSGRLFGIQFQYNPVNQLPVDYTSWVSVDVVLTSGSSSVVDLNFVDSVSERTLEGMINVPSGFTSPGVGLYLGDLLVTGATSVPGPYSVVVPNGLDVNLVLRTTATHSSGTSNAEYVVPDSTSMRDVSLAAPSAHQAPANNATGISPDTAFQWGAVPDSVYRVTFTPSSGSDPIFDVVTAETTATIPDPTSLGIPFPTGASYTWAITTYGPAESVNELFRDISLVNAAGYAFSTVSSARSFTTAN